MVRSHSRNAEKTRLWPVCAKLLRIRQCICEALSEQLNDSSNEKSFSTRPSDRQPHEGIRSSPFCINGPCETKGHKARDCRPAVRPFVGPWLSSSSSGSTWNPRLGLYTPKESDLCSWVFLASSPRLPTDDRSQDARGVLAIEVRREYCSRRAEFGLASLRRLGSTRGVGVRDDRCRFAA